MQRRLNDEKLYMEQRIKEFMRNEKIQYQKLLLKTQSEKDVIFRKAKMVLLDSKDENHLPELVVSHHDTNEVDSSSGSLPRSTPASQEDLTDMYSDGDKSPARSPAFGSMEDKKPSIKVVQKKDKPKFDFVISANNKKQKDVLDERDLMRKSYHYKKNIMSQTYSPGAFFSFDEEDPEEENQSEEEVEDAEDESPVEQPQTLTRSRGRAGVKPQQPPAQFYGSSVPISIPAIPRQREQAVNEKLPLYYEPGDTQKPETVEQRKERTKSFKTKPRLDDDPFTEVPQSYIERYMTFRDEYIQKIDTTPAVEEDTQPEDEEEKEGNEKEENTTETKEEPTHDEPYDDYEEDTLSF